MSVIAIYLIFAMFAVMVFDVTRFIIPNWLVSSLLALYPLAVWLSPVSIDWKMALVAFGVVFAVGYFIFAMRWMGGGDIKLMIVCALWVGWGQTLLDFILITTLLGGLLSVVLWVTRKFEPYYAKTKPAPRILRNGEPVPYGIAIAATMLILLGMGKIPAAGI